TQFCRKLAAERPLKDIRDEYNYPKKKGIKDECSRLLEASTMKSRRGFAIQRLMNAMRQAHADGWFIVFDTLTLADDRLERSEERRVGKECRSRGWPHHQKKKSPGPTRRRRHCRPWDPGPWRVENANARGSASPRRGGISPSGGLCLGGGRNRAGGRQRVR